MYYILYKSIGDVTEGVSSNNVVLLTTRLNFTCYFCVFHSRTFIFIFLTFSVIMLFVFFLNSSITF